MTAITLIRLLAYRKRKIFSSLQFRQVQPPATFGDDLQLDRPHARRVRRHLEGLANTFDKMEGRLGVDIERPPLLNRLQVLPSDGIDSAAGHKDSATHIAGLPFHPVVLRGAKYVVALAFDARRL